MRPSVIAVALLLMAGVAMALVYQTAARERDYRQELGRGDAARTEDQTFLAIEAYSGAIALRPDAMLPYLRRGEAYELRNEFDAAARDFRTASDLDPSAMRPLEELGDVLYERRRYDSAVETYERRLRLDDRSPAVTYRLALARYRQGDIDGALRSAADALRLNGAFATAHYLRGLCLRDKRQLPDAVDAFERAVTLSPGLIPAREELVDIYTELGRRDEALEQLQVLAGLDRQHPERQVAVGLAQARAGHPEVAVLTLGNALRRAGDQVLVYGALGRVWLDLTGSRSDALGKALKALERAAAGPTATSEILALYGRALLQANQPRSAERVLQQALDRYPVYLPAYLDYAKAAERQSHASQAREALAVHAALAPDTIRDGAR